MSLSFHICKMGEIRVFTSWGCCRNEMMCIKFLAWSQERNYCCCSYWQNKGSLGPSSMVKKPADFVLAQFFKLKFDYWTIFPFWWRNTRYKTLILCTVQKILQSSPWLAWMLSLKSSEQFANAEQTLKDVPFWKQKQWWLEQRQTYFLAVS